MKIVLTGGGSAGHVSPLLSVAAEAIASELASIQNVIWLGSHNGLEQELVMREGFAFYGTAAGKLRRYRSWQNLTDPFKLPVGVGQAVKVLRAFKPDIILSSGGAVSVPTVLAATLLRIPVILFEPNAKQGLANKIVSKRAKHICLGFPDLTNDYPKSKTTITGHPVRTNIAGGDPEKGYALTGFTSDKPVLLVMGGSQGAGYLNTFVQRNIKQIGKLTQIAHICGSNNSTKDVGADSGYKQFEYLNDELADLYAITTIALSRAGASSLAEFAAHRIPSFLIPLPTSANQHQQANAHVFELKGASKSYEESNLHDSRLIDDLAALLADAHQFDSMQRAAWSLYNVHAAHMITEILREYAKK